MRRAGGKGRSALYLSKVRNSDMNKALIASFVLAVIIGAMVFAVIGVVNNTAQAAERTGNPEQCTRVCVLMISGTCAATKMVDCPSYH